MYKSHDQTETEEGDLPANTEANQRGWLTAGGRGVNRGLGYKRKMEGKALVQLLLTDYKLSQLTPVPWDTFCSIKSAPWGPAKCSLPLIPSSFWPSYFLRFFPLHNSFIFTNSFFLCVLRFVLRFVSRCTLTSLWPWAADIADLRCFTGYFIKCCARKRSTSHFWEAAVRKTLV